MHEVTKQTRRAYDANAAEYAAKTRDFDIFPGLFMELERFGQGLPAGSPVLDLGCGAGRDSGQFAAMGLYPIAFDVSLEMLRTTNARCDAAPVQADMARLPFRTAVIPAVWACASYVHLHSSQLPQALSELLRILSAGGVAAISMKSGDSEGWSSGGIGPRWFNLIRPERFSSLLTAVGFDDVSTRFCGRPGWYVAIGHKRVQP